MFASKTSPRVRPALSTINWGGVALGAAAGIAASLVANLAVVPALVGDGDVIISDELNHASIVDGVRLARAGRKIYPHADVDALSERLVEARYEGAGRILVLSDGVFSMDGDIAPLDRITEAADEYDAMVMVDDAHGEGVLGRGGRGIVDHFDLHGRVDVEVGTMSKAFGAVGGYVAGSTELVDWLRQRGRAFLFSSAVTPPDVVCDSTSNFVSASGTVSLPACSISRIRRYQTTNAQFKFFIDDDGYIKKWRHCWTAEGWKYKESSSWTKPRYWDDSQYNAATQHVVGVSWYEAVAYANWLAAVTGKSYRLPTEAEWERAARHTDGRIYPWGNDWNANAANSEKAAIGRPVAVGIFPDGAAQCGALDMSGNVWEWCQTRWRDEDGTEYPEKYTAIDGRENLAGGSSVWHVLKGSAYYSETNVLQASVRGRHYPYYGGNSRGLRLVVSPFISAL